MLIDLDAARQLRSLMILLHIVLLHPAARNVCSQKRQLENDVIEGGVGLANFDFSGSCFSRTRSRRMCSQVALRGLSQREGSFFYAIRPVAYLRVAQAQYPLDRPQLPNLDGTANAFADLLLTRLVTCYRTAQRLPGHPQAQAPRAARRRL